jgi:hypothetical protein
MEIMRIKKAGNLPSNLKTKNILTHISLKEQKEGK